MLITDSAARELFRYADKPRLLSPNPTASLLAALGALTAGFVVRLLGAIVFGRLGDRLGRKFTFLVTVVLMGGATVLMGCLPAYESVGHISWILSLVLRLVQGLAVGAEYGVPSSTLRNARA